MSDKTEKEIILDDYKAQLNTIKKNIQIANDEMVSILSKKAEAEEDYDQVLSDIKIADNKLSLTLSRCEEENQKIETRKSKLSIAEDELSQKISSFDVYIKQEQDKLDKLAKDKQKEISNLDSQIADRQNQLINIESEIDKLNVHIEDLELSKRSLIKTIDSTEKQFNKDMKEFDSITKDKIKKIKILEVELGELETKLNFEVDKVKEPRKLLELREQELDKREANLRVLITRFKKEFKKIHPNQDPII